MIDGLYIHSFREPDWSVNGSGERIVTRRAAAPTRSIYWHFGHKDNLIAAVIEHCYATWAALLPDELPQPPTPLEEALPVFLEAHAHSFCVSVGWVRGCRRGFGALP